MIQYLPFRWILCSNQKHQIQYIINLFTINWSNRYYSNSTFLINNFFEKSTGIFYSLEELITICCNNNVRKVHEVINLGDEDEELALGFVVWIAAGFESSENFEKFMLILQMSLIPRISLFIPLRTWTLISFGSEFEGIHWKTPLWDELTFWMIKELTVTPGRHLLLKISRTLLVLSFPDHSETSTSCKDKKK